MSSHILAEVSRLARRIGIIHHGHLLQEVTVDELERNRQRHLLIRARDAAAARQALAAAGYSVGNAAGLGAGFAAGNDAGFAAGPGAPPNGTLVLTDPRGIERPDDVARLLVEAGTPPTALVVEEEELEHYFLRLVGMDGGHNG